MVPAMFKKRRKKSYVRKRGESMVCGGARFVLFSSWPLHPAA